MGIDLRATVLSEFPHKQLGNRLIIASDTVTIVPFQTEEEACYLAGLLNSTPCRATVYSYSPPGRGLGTPAILQTLGIDRFDPTNGTHKDIARLAHSLSKLHKRPMPSFVAIEDAENELDKTASKYWSLSSEDFAELKAMAEERESTVGKRADDISARMFDIATSSEEQ
jgi:hypothetical protein